MPSSKPGTSRKAVIKQKECVACGTCVTQCPKGALFIDHGSFAQVESERCVGCGRCRAACPASIIQIGEVSS
jgi:Fe-S-cluster-containing hydrogenase component 2